MKIARPAPRPGAARRGHCPALAALSAFAGVRPRAIDRAWRLMLDDLGLTNLGLVTLVVICAGVGVGWGWLFG